MTVDTSLGVDVSSVPDLDPTFGSITGIDLLAQEIVKRLQTLVLFYAPGYGLDLRGVLSSGITDSSLYSLQQQIAHQCLSDERVLDVTVALDFDPPSGALTVTINGDSAVGPFTLVVDVTALDVTLLGTGG